MKKMCGISYIALILVIIGGLTLGLVGAFNFNVLSDIFGATGVGIRVVYIVIGLSALWTIRLLCCCKKSCTPSE